VAAEIATPTIDDVLGWQRVTLAKNAVCTRCNALLPRGSDAAVGIVAAAEVPTSPLVICIPCFEELRK
jgi:hypothetical protein